MLTLALCAGWGQSTAVAGELPMTDGRGLPGWEAVGRLVIAEQNMCTGALIAPDIVLTAAHCLFNVRSGRQLEPSDIEFQAGLVGNKAKAVRQVSHAVIAQDYRYRPAGQKQIGTDLAILRLDHPISREVIVPLQTHDRPQQGDAVGVISYQFNNRTQPLLEEPCYVLARRHETVVMSCAVEFGASGSPVFISEGRKRPRLVSVVTAKAMMGGKQVSVATVLDRALKQLLKRAG